jgi:serine protease inhibitor
MLNARDWQTRRKDQEEEEKVVARVNELLSKVDPTQITVANALWVEKTYPLKQTYIDRVSRFYGTGALRPADFRGSFDTERVRINSWVEKLTRERIKDLLPKGSLSEETRLVLANAIYFKGEWVEPFKKENTRKEDFTLANGRKAKVPLMKERMKKARYSAFTADGTIFNTPVSVSRDDKTARYPGKDGFSIIELPYRGGKLAMVMLAPNSPAGLGAIEKQLDAKTLEGWIDQLKGRAVYVRVPKFKSETEYTMNKMLMAMGMVSAFKDPRFPDGANFKGMTDSQRLNDQLYIGLVQHKAFVAVDEEGTEAAAATAVAMVSATSIPTTVPFTPEFRADRPFLFLIRDVKTGCILFTGRMMEP